jgi:phage gp36-like protein
MKANKSTKKTNAKKRTTSKKQLTVKQRKGETVLRKIKNALGDTAAKIKTFLPRKSGAIKKRNDTVRESD